MDGLNGGIERWKSRQYDDGQSLGDLWQLVNKFQVFIPGHFDVSDQQVIAIFLNELYRGVTIPGTIALISFFAEKIGH
jgi:hypothetical protein